MTKTGDVGLATVEWYRSILGADDGIARATRARLKRCQSTVEAMTIAETHVLFHKLKETADGRTPLPDQVALIAIIFARLKGVEGRKLASRFGEQETRDGPRRLSRLRFQSIIRVRTHRELILPLRRSLEVLGADTSCNGLSLAWDLYSWSEGVRKSWCFQYFGSLAVEGTIKETLK